MSLDAQCCTTNLRSGSTRGQSRCWRTRSAGQLEPRSRNAVRNSSRCRGRTNYGAQHRGRRTGRARPAERPRPAHHDGRVQKRLGESPTIETLRATHAAHRPELAQVQPFGWVALPDDDLWILSSREIVWRDEVPTPPG
jgi:hypothetical protein